MREMVTQIPAPAGRPYGAGELPHVVPERIPGSARALRRSRIASEYPYARVAPSDGSPLRGVRSSVGA